MADAPIAELHALAPGEEVVLDPPVAGPLDGLARRYAAPAVSAECVPGVLVAAGAILDAGDDPDGDDEPAVLDGPHLVLGSGRDPDLFLLDAVGAVWLVDAHTPWAGCPLLGADYGAGPERECLRLLGLEGRVRHATGPARVDAVVCGGPAPEGPLTPSPLVAGLAGWLRTRLAAPAGGGGRIALAGEGDAVGDALAAELGFERLDPATASVARQAAAFAAADVVVAPRDAGLTAVLLARPGALALELLDAAGLQDTATRRLASLLGVRYGRVPDPAPETVVAAVAAQVAEASR
ncbi:MAG TPA: glycosyltransferase 61 family protein [Solirubrobacteraceae bacterium]|jgi:hypothetical protein